MLIKFRQFPKKYLNITSSSLVPKTRTPTVHEKISRTILIKIIDNVKSSPSMNLLCSFLTNNNTIKLLIEIMTPRIMVQARYKSIEFSSSAGKFVNLRGVI